MTNQRNPGSDIPDADISKSQRRRDALELKALARRLIELPAPKLARVPIDSDLREAIEEARQIRSNVARKRQLQYVAKLMRRVDAEPLLDSLEEFDGEARHLVARQHRVETWRDHLLANGDHGVGLLLQSRRDADAQTLRALLRNAGREATLNKPPAAARKLFRLLRELDEIQPLPPLDEK